LCNSIRANTNRTMKKLYVLRRQSTVVSFIFLQFLLIGALVFFGNKGYSQRTYATVAPSTGRNAGVQLVGLIGGFTETTDDNVAKITGAANAAVGDDASFATLHVMDVNLLLLEVFGQSWLQMKYDHTLPAGKTTFIRIDPPAHSGISLSTLDLLNLLGDAVNVEAYAGATASSNGTLINSQHVTFSIIKNIEGKYYIAVTSAQPYNSVRVTLTFSSGLLGLALGANYQMRIYNAFYEGQFPGDCGLPWATDEGDITGIGLNLGVLKSLGINLSTVVADPTNAIDNNPNSASVITPGVLNVAGTASQTVFMNGSGGADDVVRMILSLPASILQLNLFNNISVQAYNGNTPVGGQKTLRDLLLDLDLLSLFANSNKVTVYYKPGGPFDRVKINYSALVGVGGNILGGGLSVYDVARAPEKPTVLNLTNDTVSVCLGSTPTLTVDAKSGYVYKWYNDSTAVTPIATGTSYAPPIADLQAGNNKYFVSATVVGCAVESERTKINVVVNPPAVASDIAVSDGEICSGYNAVITPASTIPGAVFQWYKDNARTQPITNGLTEGTVVYQISGNGVLSVSGLPKNAGAVTYYVSVSGTGKCENAPGTLKPVTVTVKPSPDAPMVSASATTVPAGQSVVLTATSNEPNALFSWYTTSTGGSAIGNGNQFVTPPLTSSATYYVEVTGENGCVSPTRAQITINVTPSGPVSPIGCEAAVNDLAAGVDGVLGIGAGVSNRALAVDNNPNTGSTLVMPVGLLASVYHRVGFNGLSGAGDTVLVRLSSAGKLLSLALLPSVTITTYNGSNSNNDELPVNSPLLVLELLSSGQEAIIKYVPTQAFDGVEVRLNSGVLGALTSINFNYAQRIVATPTAQVSAAGSICPNGTATLNVQNPVPGVVYKWYDASGNYQSGKDGVSFTTPALTSDTKFYVEATRNGCASARAEVAVDLTEVPAIPQLASTSVTTCAGSDVSLTVLNAQPGATYRWFKGATEIGTGTTITIPNVTTNGTYSVVGENACGIASAATEINITAGMLGAPTVLPATQTIQVGQQAAFTASTSTSGATIEWYNAADQLQASTPVFTTPVMNTPGTYTYYAKAVSGACTSDKATVTLVVTGAQPVAPTLCELPTSETHGVTGIALGGGVFNAGAAIDDDANTSSLLALPVGVLATAWQKVNFAGQSNIGDTVVMKISSPASLLTVGVLPALSVTTYNGAASNNDTKTLDNPLLKVQLLGGGSEALISFVPTAVFDAVEFKFTGGLVSLLNSVQLNYVRRGIVAPSLDVTTTTICAGDVATLSVVNPQPGITYKWYQGATYLAAKDGAVLVTDPLPAGSHLFTVRASRNGCESFGTNISVQAQELPSPPVPSASNPASICQGSTATLSVTTVGGMTYNWYDASNNQIAVNSSSYNVPSNLVPGTYTYYVEAINSNNCSSSSRATVTLTVNRLASAADVNAANQSVCLGSDVVITPTSSISNPVFTWYEDNAKTSPITSGVNGAGVLTKTGLTAGTYTYYVSVSGTGVCENGSGNLKAVEVVVKPNTNPTTEITALPVTVCSGTRAQLTAFANLGITNPVFTWYSDAALTNVVATTASFTTPELSASRSYYVTVSGDNRCAGSAANAKEVMVTVQQGPDLVTVSTEGTTACHGSITTLLVENPQTGITYEWYSAATGGVKLGEGTSFTTPAITTATNYYVSATNGTCNTLSRTRVLVNVVDPTPVPGIDAGSDLTICEGTTATLKISEPAPNLVYSWYDAPVNGNLLHRGTQFTTDPLQSGQTFYVSAAQANGCVSALKDVAVAVNPAPAAPAVTTANQEVCRNSNVILSVNNPQSGFTYHWYTQATGGTPVYTGTSYTINGIQNSVTYYIEAVNANSCGSITRGSATVTVMPDPGTATVTTSAPAVCSGEAVVLSASSSVPGASFRWYTTATGGASFYTGAVLTTGAITTDTSFYVEVVNAGGCPGSTRVKTDIGILRQLAAPQPVVESITPTSITFGWPTVPGATGYEISLDNGVSYIPVSGGASGLSYTVAGLQPNTEISVQVRSLGLGSCQTSPASGRITGKTENPLGNSVFIPNAFTPNGDGRNDEFLVYGTAIQSVHMLIYNQYGEQLFESKDKGRGWDGKFNGKPQPAGVYVYTIRITMQDGTTMTKKGTVNLIR